jgi:hypothetical protein
MTGKIVIAGFGLMLSCLVLAAAPYTVDLGGGAYVFSGTAGGLNAREMPDSLEAAETVIRLFGSLGWRWRPGDAWRVRGRFRWAQGVTGDDDLARPELLNAAVEWNGYEPLEVCLGRISAFEQLLPLRYDGLDLRWRFSPHYFLRLAGGLRTPWDSGFDYSAGETGGTDNEWHGALWLGTRLAKLDLNLVALQSNRYDGESAAGAEVKGVTPLGCRVRGLFTWNFTQQRPHRWSYFVSRSWGSRLALSAHYRLVAPDWVYLDEFSRIQPKAYDNFRFSFLTRPWRQFRFGATQLITRLDGEYYSRTQFLLGYLWLDAGAVYLRDHGREAWRGSFALKKHFSWGLTLSGGVNMTDYAGGTDFSSRGTYLGSSLQAAYRWHDLSLRLSLAQAANPAWDNSWRTSCSLRYAWGGRK